MNNFIVTKIIDRYYYLFRINRYVFFIDLLKAFLSVAMDRYNLHPKKTGIRRITLRIPVFLNLFIFHP